MSEMTGKPKLSERISGAKLKIGLALGAVLMIVGPAAAADINWTMITDILDGLANNMFPSLITLITAAVPIIIVVTIVGFVVAFLDKILAMLKM